MDDGAREQLYQLIRDAVALDPMISLRKLQALLDERKYHISDLSTIAKYRDRVKNRAIQEMSQTKVEERMTKTSESLRLVINRLQRIAFWSPNDKDLGGMPPSYNDQVKALKGIIELDIKLFNAQLDAGLFKRHIGELEINRRFTPLPDETRNNILRVMKSWGIHPGEKPQSKIVIYNSDSEVSGPIDVEAKTIENKKEKQDNANHRSAISGNKQDGPTIKLSPFAPSTTIRPPSMGRK